MIKSIRAKWQAWLDGTPQPMFERPEVVEPEVPELVRSIAGRPNPYLGLAVVRERARSAMYEHPSVADPAYTEPSMAGSLATPRQRAYEAALPDWAREALGEMDRVVGAVLHEVVDEVRTPQYIRRHRRGLMETIDDALALTEDTDPDELVQRMFDRAKRASAPDITGVIPAIPVHEITEEAWA